MPEEKNVGGKSSDSSNKKTPFTLFRVFLLDVSPAGVEPAPIAPQAITLSIELWGLDKKIAQKQYFLKHNTLYVLLFAIQIQRTDFWKRYSMKFAIRSRPTNIKIIRINLFSLRTIKFLTCSNIFSERFLKIR